MVVVGLQDSPRASSGPRHNTERIQTDVLNLLETYRAALRMSRPRDRHAVDPKEITTVYYRLHTNVAEDLAILLPKLLQPGTWKKQRPDAPGEIFRAASEPELIANQGQLKNTPSGSVESAENLVVSRAVLIVRQSRAVHDEIAEVIRRVQQGDVQQGGQIGVGGSFGGGFFKVD